VCPALARFFAEPGEFLFIEASPVFFEDLLRAGQARLVHVDLAGAARNTARALPSTAHTGYAGVVQARDQQRRLRSVAHRCQKREHPKGRTCDEPMGVLSRGTG